MAALPPIAASTWPTRVVGTATQSIPRRYVAATKPATSVVQPPPKATSVPPRSSRSCRQRRSAVATVFASSPAGTVSTRPSSGGEWSSRTRASAERDHARRQLERLQHDPLLDLAEDAPLEELPDRALSLLDLGVHIEKRPIQPRRNLPAERRLAGAHEADQRDMPP